MKKQSIILATTILLAACGSVEDEAKLAVLGRLKDPDSAKFGKFTQIDENNACLTVNARNSMGGYVGNHQALLARKDGQWITTDIIEISHQSCIDTLYSAVVSLRKDQDKSNPASTAQRQK